MQSRPAIVIGSLVLAFVLSVAPSSAQAPPSAADAQAAIDRSPRHGEWVSIERPPVQIKSWVMYPERSDRAAVVIVIHPGDRLNDWTRAIADRLAADGYLAIAPDLDVHTEDRVLALDAVRDHALKIPAANGKVATLGFEQGGYTSFQYALARPALDAAIAFSAPFTPHLENSEVGRAPILAIYGRKPAGADYTRHKFEEEIYLDVSDDFVSARDTTRDEAASRLAWNHVLAFLRKHLQ
jgi:carboxymethylenebutenolidase